MRENLSRISNQYVLCKGWIDGWWDVDEDQIRFLIKNPIIKKQDMNLRYQDQEILAKEDHINLFLKKRTLHKFNIDEDEINRLDEVSFAGVVKGYTRSDGSKDYGIYPTEQSTLHYEFQEVIVKTILKMKDTPYLSKSYLLFLELTFKKEIWNCIRQLESFGKYLPTFTNTYEEYSRIFNESFGVGQTQIDNIRSICNSRKFRRTHNVKTNFAKEVPTFEEVKNVLHY